MSGMDLKAAFDLTRQAREKGLKFSSELCWVFGLKPYIWGFLAALIQDMRFTGLVQRTACG
jgi:hypothetical protein